jgi:hypothetical protein
VAHIVKSSICSCIRVLRRGRSNTTEKGRYCGQEQQVLCVVLLGEANSRDAVVHEILEGACNHLDVFCHLCANRMEVALHRGPSELIFIFLETTGTILEVEYDQYN